MVYYGLAAWAVIIILAFALRSKNKFEDACVGAAILALVAGALPALSVATTWLRPLTMDAQLRHVDLALHLDGLALTRWLFSTNLYGAVGPVYYSLTIVFALAWSIDHSRELLLDSFVAAVAALPLYLLIPAVGPQYAFANFPEVNATLQAIGNHPRNCFPSLHMAWMLLVVIDARNRVWRWVAIAYAVPMAIATVGSGEHYFIDLIAAIPFAFGIHFALSRLFPVNQGPQN